MQDWLVPELDRGAVVVTASRRLARTLASRYTEAQIQAGKTAWATPPILTQGRWLSDLLATSDEAPGYRLTATQSRVLWESCLVAELGGAHDNLSGIVRSAEEAWGLMQAFRLPLDVVRRRIENRDQGIFARAALRYQRRLDKENWLDEASLARGVEAAIGAGRIRPPARVVFAGFDRVTPVLKAIADRIEEAGGQVLFPTSEEGGTIPVRAADDSEAEWRAAGRWALEQLQESPNQRVAIIATGLEREPATTGRLVREGATPGWQSSSSHSEALVNVSLGAPVDSFPMVATALLVIRWLHSPLTSRQLGVLLRCPFIGVESSDARARLETRLREIPARDWIPARFLRVFTNRAAEPDTLDFLSRVGSVIDIVEAARGTAAPSEWASVFDAALTAMGWPGSQPLDSGELQLLNRWRDLFNEFAQLEVVTGSIALGDAAERLRAMARDTVFQPEDTRSVIDVLGPLEASGLSFDAVWVTGLTAENWPPPSRPTPLLPRRLAREYGLPDSTPEDTRRFADVVLKRIAGSSSRVTGSFPRMDGDSEQSASLLDCVDAGDDTVVDPGWFAREYRTSGRGPVEVDDRVPGLLPGERIRGGSATLNAQLSEPFTAFARGRLGISSLDAFAEGLTPLMRGNMLHDALRHLYADCPSQDTIKAWPESSLAQRARKASQRAVARHRVAAGATLERLLDFEEQRIVALLLAVVQCDLGRPPFRIASVEGKSDGSIGGIELSLRHDRIDAAPDGSLTILDYKTGAEKKFLDRGRPADYQLVTYAATIRSKVGALGLYNVDSRDVKIDGVGESFGRVENFEQELEAWIGDVEAAAAMLKQGDVRVNRQQGASDARALALLSRYQELVRHG